MDMKSLADKAGELAGDALKKDKQLVAKAGDAVGKAAKAIAGKLPDSVKDKAGDLAEGAAETATKAIGALADKLTKKD